MRVDALGLPITLDLEGARVVLIGPDDDERRRKQTFVEEAGADLVLVLPDDFSDDKVDGARLVMVTARLPELVARVAVAVRATNALLWCNDAPAYSDFAMPAIARLGRARIAVSTGGAAPALARRIREQLETALDNDTFKHFVDELAKIRDQLSVIDFEERRELLAEAIEDFELGLSLRYPDWLK